MRSELLALKRLQENPDFEVLRGFWIPLIAKIEEQRDRAAAKMSEDRWSYYAGQEKGAKLIAGALLLAIEDLETKGKDEEPSENFYEDLLNEARGVKK